MVNGTHAIGSAGTLTDFFTELQTQIPALTGWTLTDSTELSLTLNTHIHDVTVVITDKVITDTTSTSTSSQLTVAYQKGNSAITSFGVSYLSQAKTQETETTRKIVLNVYNGFTGICTYSTTSYAIANLFGALTVKNIGTGAESERILIDSAVYNIDTLESRTLQKPLSYVAEAGVVTINALTYTSPKYYEYVKGLLSCSTVTAGINYQINNKKYFAIDSNYLIEL